MIYLFFFFFSFFQEERRRLKNAIIIQSFVRGYRDRKHQVSIHLFIEKDAKQFCCKTGFLEKKKIHWEIFGFWVFCDLTEHKFFSSYLPMNLIFLVDECRALLWQLTSVGLHIVVLCLQCVWKHLHTCSLHLQPSHASEALCVCVCVCEAKVVAWVKRFFLLGWLFCLNLLIFIE